MMQVKRLGYRLSAAAVGVLAIVVAGWGMIAPSVYDAVIAEETQGRRAVPGHRHRCSGTVALCAGRASALDAEGTTHRSGSAGLPVLRLRDIRHRARLQSALSL